MPVSKPATLPTWATNGGTTTEPPGALKATGVAGGSLLRAKYFNWLFYWVCSWLAWLNDLTNQALTWAAGATFNQSTAAEPAVTATGGVGGGQGVCGYGGTVSGGTGAIGVLGVGTGDQAGVKGSGGGTGPGVYGSGSGSAAGVYGSGGDTGPGVQGVGGTTGPGLKGTGGPNGGDGIEGTATGTGIAVKASANTGDGQTGTAASMGLDALADVHHFAARFTNVVYLVPLPSAPTDVNMHPEGAVYYDSTAHTLKVYNGSNWKSVTLA